MLPLHGAESGLHPGWLCLLSDHSILLCSCTMVLPPLRQILLLFFVFSFPSYLFVCLFHTVTPILLGYKTPIGTTLIRSISLLSIWLLPLSSRYKSFLPHTLYIYLLPLSFIPFREQHPRHNLIRFSLFIEPDTCLGII